MGAWRKVMTGAYGGRDAITWVAMDGCNDITTSGIGPDVDYMREIQAVVDTKFELTDLAITGPGRHPWKTNAAYARTDDFYETHDSGTPWLYPNSSPAQILAVRDIAREIVTTEVVKQRGAQPVASSPVIMHGIGMPQEDFYVNLNDVADYLESLTGHKPTVVGYPYHVHDRHVMYWLKKHGYLAARDGDAHSPPQVPKMGFLHAHYTNVIWWETWDHWQPWEMVIHGGFYESALAATTSQDTPLDDTSMHSLLYTTNVFNAAAGTSIYLLPLYTSALQMWKDKCFWGQVYSHANGGAGNVSNQQLRWFLDELIADGDVWISDMQTIAEYAHQHHEPTSDEMFYEPLAGHAAADYGDEPWNGKKCALTFSSDDGVEGLNTDFFATCVARDVRMTAFIIQDTIGAGGYLTEAEITAGHNAGGVRFGVHCYTQSSDAPFLTKQAFAVRNDSAYDRAITVEDSGGARTLKWHYNAATPNWWHPITGLDGFEFMFAAETLDPTLGDGDLVTTISPVSGTVDPFTQPDVPRQTTFQENEIDTDKSVIRFDGINDSLLGDATRQVGSNVNGLTLFVVGLSNNAGVASDCFWAKGEAGAATRLFRFERQQIWLFDGLGGSTSAIWRAGGVAAGAYHVLIATWIPGQGVRSFYNGYTVPAATGGNMAALNLTSTSIHRVGLWRHQTSDPLDGDVVCWGACSHGWSNGHDSLKAIYETLANHYGL